MDVLLASLVARSATEVAIGAARARSCVALSRRPTMELHKNSIGLLGQRLIKGTGVRTFWPIIFAVSAVILTFGWLYILTWLALEAIS
jgi:hypothetical protein